VEHDLVPVAPLVLVEVVHRAEVEEELVVELRVIAEEPGGLHPSPALHGDREVAAEISHTEDEVAERFGEDADGWPGEDLRRGGGGASHARPPSCVLPRRPRPRLAARAAVDRPGPDAPSGLPLRLFRLLALLDPLLDLHERSEEGLRGRRATGT